MIEADHHPSLHADFGKFLPKLASYVNYLFASKRPNLGPVRCFVSRDTLIPKAANCCHGTYNYDTNQIYQSDLLSTAPIATSKYMHGFISAVHKVGIIST